MFNNFLKNGPGVEKTKKPLGGFMQYFSSLYHNFTKLMLLNIINLVILVPYAFFMTGIKEELGISAGFGYLFDILSMTYLSCVGVAPLMAGMVYLLSLFAKDEPSFVISDFASAVKGNIKNSMWMLAVNVVVFYLFTVGYKFYFASNFGNGILKVGYFIILLIWMIVHIFANYINVAYRLKVKSVYKKALIFTFLNLPQNIIVMAGIVVIYGLCFFITTLLGYFVAGIIMYSLTGLMINLYAIRAIKKYER